MTFLGIVFFVLLAYLVVRSLSSKHIDRRKKQTAPSSGLSKRITITVTPNIIRNEDESVQSRFGIGQCWLPKGQPYTLGSYRIADGMVYIGETRQVYDRSSGYRINEPSLIDPTLPLDSKNPDREGTALSYYPNYSSITPQARAAYIEWLSGGKKDPQVPIGYVFLYFYGLERRALVDLEKDDPKDEQNEILEEVKRLLTIYSNNWSVRRYAGNLISYILAKQGRWDEIGEAQRLYDIRGGDELPISFRIGIASYLIKQEPIPSDWALDWVRLTPFTELRTPATRCLPELRYLFRIRYYNLFGDGLVVKPNKTSLTISYRPASEALLASRFSLPTPFPDISRLTQPLNKIKPLVLECVDELDAFSRYLGRHPEARESMQALALLPRLLLTALENRILNTTRDFLRKQDTGSGPVIVQLDELLQIWGIASDGKMNKSDSTSIAQLLQGLGYGIEPDPRIVGTGLKTDEPIVIFEWNDPVPIVPGREFGEALQQLQLSALVCLADEIVTPSEQQHLHRIIDRFSTISAGERLRLRAHLLWFVAAKPNRNGILKKLEQLPTELKGVIAAFLLDLAKIDGSVDPGEVKILSNIYTRLGFSGDYLHQAIHQTFTRETNATEPVIVQTAGAVEEGYTIPAEDKASVGIRLDRDAISRKMNETVAVTNLLHDIFSDGESPLVSENVESDSMVINPALTELMKELVTKQEWNRQEVEVVCQRLGLMTEGALESLNEMAYDLVGSPLVEGEETLTINQEVYEEIKNGIEG